MPVDQGGLDYGIKVAHDLSGLIAFQKEVADSREAWAALKADLAEGSASSKLSTEAGRAAREETKRFNARAAALRKFRQEMKAAATDQALADINARNNFNNQRRLNTENQNRVRAEKEVTRAINERGRAERVAQSLAARGIKLTNEELRKLRLMTAEQQSLFAAEKRLADQRRVASNARLRQLNAETAAQRIVNREQQKAATAQILASRGLDPRGQPQAVSTAAPNFIDRLRRFVTGGTGSKAAGELKKVGDQTDRASRSASGALFSFGRLFRIFLLFQAVRGVVNFFRELVIETVRFNAQIETATLGVATLILAVGKVRDPIGQAVTAAQGLALAEREARRQMRLLRNETLQTTSTFENLVDAFQTAIAPGLVSGLRLDEIRRFTVQISQAATAIGLAQNQLPEEIRSILQGTIQARTTRIAVALGITNEDIRNAKELGILADFLNEKFVAFNEGGKRTLNTFNGILNRLRTGIELILQSSGLDFFEELKGLLTDTFNLLVSTDKITGEISPSPDAVRAFRFVFEGIREAVSNARQMMQNLDIQRVTELAQGIGGALRLASDIVAGIITGVVRGGTDFLRIVKTVATLVRNFTGIDLFENGTRETVATVARIVSLVGLLVLSVNAVAAGLGLVKAAAVILIAPFTALAGLAGAMNVSMLPLAAVLAAILATVLVIAAGLTIWNSEIGESLDDLLGISEAWDLIRGAIELSLAPMQTLVDMGKSWLETLVDDKETLDDINGTLRIIKNTMAFGILGLAYSVGDALKSWFDNLTGLDLKFNTIIKLMAAVRDRLVGNLALDIEEALRTGFTRFEAFRRAGINETALALVAAKETAGAISPEEADQQRQILFANAQRDQEILSRDAIKNIQAEFAERRRLLDAETQKVFDDAKKINEKSPTIVQVFQDRFKKILEGLGPLIDGLLDKIFDKFGVKLPELPEVPAPDTAGVQKFSDLFESLPPIIDRSTDAIESQAKAIEDMRDEINSARDDLEQTAALIGLEGRVMEQARASLQAQAELRSRSREIDVLRLQTQAEIEENDRKQARNMVDLNRLREEDRNIVFQGMQAGERILAIQREIGRLENDAAIKQALVRKLIREGREEEAKLAGEDLKNALGAVDAAKDRLEAERANADAMLEGVENADKILRLTGDILTAQGQEAVLLDRLLSLDKGRLAIQLRLQQIASDRIRAASIAEQFELNEETQRLDAQLRAMNRMAKLRQDLQLTPAASDVDRNVALTTNEVELLEVENRLAEASRRRHEDALRARIEEQRAQVAGLTAIRDQLALDREATKEATTREEISRKLAETEADLADQSETILELERQEGLELQRNNQQRDIEHRRMQEILALQAEAVAIQQNQIGTGIVAGFVAALNEIPSAFETTKDIILNGVREMSSIVADVFASAFDLEKKVDIRQRIAQFMAGVAKTIIAYLTQIAIAKAALGLTGFLNPTAGPVAGAGLGFAEGGRVPGRKASGRLTRALGYAGGGRIDYRHQAPARFRPRHLDRRDTTPIWAQPGEFMQPLRAVRAYGADYMEQLRQVAIDPMQARSLAGLTTRSQKASAARRDGFAAGGSIGRPTAAATAGVTQASAAGGPAVAVMAPSQAAFEALVTGNRNAMVRFIRENWGEISAGHG